MREEEKKGTGWNGVGAQGAEGNIKGKEKGGIDQWRDRGEEGWYVTVSTVRCEIG